MSRLRGPFYTTSPGSRVYLKPDEIRWVKGKWRSYVEFANAFGRDVLHEWDAATTLQEYLEGQHAD